jgi:hypothetical protein
MATSILITKSTYRSLSAQRLSERSILYHNFNGTTVVYAVRRWPKRRYAAQTCIQTLNLVLIIRGKAQSIFRNWHSLSYRGLNLAIVTQRSRSGSQPESSSHAQAYFFRVYLNFTLPSTKWSQALNFRISNWTIHITLSYTMPHSWLNYH